MHLPHASTGDDAIALDIAAINRIGAIPSLLRVICDFTGMGFAAVARVTDDDWTACAVLDAIGFGLQPGDHLDLETTLCCESRAAREAIAFDHASEDPIYRDHHTPRIYRIESYISVPIVRKDGKYFGNRCAIDRKPRRVSDERTLTMFKLFADLIALQLESEDRQEAAETALSTERSTSQLREQFIAVLGHDLRSPLSAIQMSGDLLLRRKEQPDLVNIGTRLRSAAPFAWPA
jgi:GAF domain-containing protein